MDLSNGTATCSADTEDTPELTPIGVTCGVLGAEDEDDAGANDEVLIADVI